MPALEDLSPCEYAPGVHAFAVGWLAEGRAYTRGEVSREHFRQLAALLVNPWEPVVTAGRHACPFCRFTGGPGSVVSDGCVVPVGSRVVFVPSEHRLYVAPSLILHYVDAHAYAPPAEFVAAVASCPPMRSMAYLTQLRALGVSVRP